MKIAALIRGVRCEGKTIYMHEQPTPVEREEEKTFFKCVLQVIRHKFSQWLPFPGGLQSTSLNKSGS